MRSRSVIAPSRNITFLVATCQSSDFQTGFVFERAFCHLKQPQFLAKQHSLLTIFNTMIQICCGLSALHNSYNIVHTDIKLENILLFKNGTVKLSDFGHSLMARPSPIYSKTPCIDQCRGCEFTSIDFRAPEVFFCE